MSNFRSPRWVAFALVVTAVALGACESKSESDTTATTSEAVVAKAAKEEAPAEKATPAKAEKPSSGPVKVAKGGTEFDPPVKMKQIPDGAWVCDMGTVHYARLEKGDGKCPLCKMDLTQKRAEEKSAGAGGSGGEHDSHEH
jgi:glucose/arabinose dehydrogenase